MDNPNILIIVVDALRADRTGFSGYHDITPHIDEMAADSAIFSNAFTTSNATDIAVTSIQTGRYPLSHGIINHGLQVTEDEKSRVRNVPQLPQLLSDTGYRTAKFGRPLGRWHRKGFDRYPTVSEYSRPFDNPKKSRSIKKKASTVLDDIHPSVKNAVSTVYSHTFERLETSSSHSDGEDKEDTVVDNFKEFVSDSSPFFSFVHLMNPHSPRSHPNRVKEYLEKFDYDQHPLVRDSVGSFPSFEKEVDKDFLDKYYVDGRPSSAVREAKYDAAVTEADQRVGQMLDYLKRNDVYDDTLIFVLADHGEYIGEKGIYFQHGHGLHDPVVRVPFVVSPPDHKKHIKSDQLVQITDIVPTIGAYADSSDVYTDGTSLKPILDGTGSIDREFILAEHSYTGRRRMIRSLEEKFIYSLDGDTICRMCEVEHSPAEELYNLADDPGESWNLAHENQERANELRERADSMAATFERNGKLNQGSDSVNYEDEEEIHDQLRALGYK